MIVDAHHHLLDRPGYAEELAAECRRLGIAKVCVFAAGKLSAAYGVGNNDAVRAAMGAHPDVIVGFASFDLGIDPPEAIDRFADQGFRGVKFINPAKPYADRGFYDVYERIERRGLPAIFHLGIVARTAEDRRFDVDSERHRPIYLDTIARAFPGLTLIGAHLGNPWYEEAAMACRWNPNLYFDLSGSTLKCKSPEFLGGLLWWTPATRYRDRQGRHAWEKIVFGSDVPCGEIEDVLNDYRRVMGRLGVAPDLQAGVLGGTMARLLGVKCPAG